MQGIIDERMKLEREKLATQKTEVDCCCELIANEPSLPMNDKELKLWWQCYVQEVTSSKKKQCEKVIDVFMRMHHNCPQVLVDLFNVHVVTPLKEHGRVQEAEFKMLSAILENNGLGRDVLWTLRSVIYDHLLTFVTQTVDGLDLGNDHLQAKLHACVRSILKMEQCYYHSWTVERKCKTFGELERRIRLALISVVMCDNCESESCLLAGTAFGFFLHSFCDSRKSLELFLSAFPLTGKLNAIWNLGEELGNLSVNDVKSDSEITSCNSAIFLLHGLLTCGKTSILLDTFGLSDQPFVMTLIPLLVDLCNCPKQNAYHTFSTLVACMKFVLKNVEELRRNLKNKDSVWVLDKTTITTLVNMLNFNWSNPIVGVTGLARDAFKFIIEIHCTEVRLSSGIARPDEPYVDDLCDEIMCQPWTAKSKYPPLAILVPYIGLKKLLSKHPSILEDFSESLSSNSISSVGCEVYRALIQQLRKENAGMDDTDLMELWDKIFLKPLILALYQSDGISYRNAVRHMLAPTLKLFPLAFDRIWFQINHDGCQLALLVTVLRLSRAYGIHSLSNEDLQLLKCCLNNTSEEIREEAFATICSCSKKAEPVSLVEMDLLEDFIANNLNVDCASFRHQLICNFKVLVVRLRNSCLSWLSVARREGRDHQDHNQMFRYSMDFLDYLFHLILRNLSPGGCYQRRQTCLLLYKCLVETFYTNESSCSRRKGIVPAKTPALLEYFQRENKCTLLSTEMRHVLFGCLLDYMDEIKDLSLYLLNNYFDNDPESSSHEGAEDLLRWAVRLCCSPKATLCQSGARLFHYLFSRAEVAQQLFLIESLRTDLQKQLTAAKEDLFQASRNSPMHGCLSALSLLFGDCQRLMKNCDAHDSLTTLLSDCIHAACDVVVHILSVLGVNADAANAPSFEDMGEAIDGIVTAACETDSGANLCSSYQHQLVQSCCWLSLKEGCLFLGTVVHNCLPLRGSSSNESFLVNRDDVVRAGDTLVSVLLTCRHRGAIEACSLGFELFCEALMKSCDAAYTFIVHKILSDALKDVASSDMLTSVTRRSAGLPLLIQTVASSEPIGQQKFLSESMRVLLETSRIPLPEVWNEMLDSPQTRALHILRALIHDSRFSQVILPFLNEVVIACLDSFVSPSWAVRNAGLQLFGGLIPRLLGQKKVSEDESGHNRIACNEFFVRWPKLREFLMSELENADPESLRPTILPILSLLGRLAPATMTGGAAQQVDSSAIVRTIHPLLGCPIWHVRKMAARDIATLLTDDCAAKYFRNVCKLLALKRGCANVIHGHLLLLRALLENANAPSLRKDDRECYRRGLDNCFSIFPALSVCPVLQMAMMDVVLAAPRILLPSQLLDISTSAVFSEPGSSSLVQKVTYWKLIRCSEDVMPLLEDILNHNLNVDECEACLKYLSVVLREGNSSSLFWIGVQNLLCPLLACISLPSLLLTCQQLISDICILKDVFPDVIHYESLLNFSAKMAKGDYGASVRAVSAVFLAIAVKIKLPVRYSPEMHDCIESWTSLIHANASPELSEVSRMSVAVALNLGGLQLLKSVVEQDVVYWSANIETCILRIFDATLLLLQDEQVNIRKETSKFVSALSNSVNDREDECLHSNLAIEYFGCYFVRHFHSLNGLGKSIWEKFSCASQLEGIVLNWGNESSHKVALFEQEEINVYAERCFMTKRYVDILKGLCVKNSEMLRELFDSRSVAEIIQRANLVNTWLESQKKLGIGVLEIVTQMKITPHLCNLSAQLEVLLSSQLKDNEKSCLTREYEKLHNTIGFTW